MDTDLFMKRWILLMKYCEVKTKKQGYLVFLETHLIRRNFADIADPGSFFHIYFLHGPATGKLFGAIVNFYRYFMVL